MVAIAGARVCIYGLVDPRTNELRYVGKTATSLKRRLQRHLNQVARGDRGRHVLFWLASVIARGQSPIIFEIESDLESANWMEAEQFWIAYFRSIGARLCNLTAGGDGSPGLVWSSDVRAKHRRVRESEPYKANAARISKNNWANNRPTIISAQKAAKGVDFRNRQSAARKALWSDPEWRRRVSLAHQGKLSEGDVRAILELLNTGFSQTAVAARFGVSQSLISRIKSNQRWAHLLKK